MASKKLSYKDLQKNNDNSLVSAFSVGKSVVPKATGQVTIKIEEIREDPKGDFTDIFPFNDEMVQSIAESVETKGFDITQFIHLARIREEPDTMESPIRIDGRHRVEAAKKVGLEEIPAFIHTFDTRAEALIYTYEHQLLRRNLTAGEKFTYFKILDGLKKTGRKESDEEPTGKSAAEVAAAIGVSERMAERMRNIANNGDEEIQEAVKNGEMTVSKADKIINEKKKASKKEDDYEDDISESLGTNEGTPSGLNFNHSDGIERPVPKTGDDTVFVTLEEKNIQCETARKQGFSDGFYKCLVFCLGEIKRGKTPEEVWNDERLKDLSPSIIADFEVPPEDEDMIINF